MAWREIRFAKLQEYIKNFDSFILIRDRDLLESLWRKIILFEFRTTKFDANFLGTEKIGVDLNKIFIDFQEKT